MVPGKPNQGTLIDAISWNSWEMPPKENDRLTKAQIELFREWIKNGAPWPDEKTQQRYRQAELSRPSPKTVRECPQAAVPRKNGPTGDINPRIFGRSLKSNLFENCCRMTCHENK